jgi:membrane protein implicated in regulation of membrane protease activity
VFIHLIVIGWLYVAVMMAVAEATNTNGTVLGAIFTFLLYGLAPVALVVYLMGTPARRRAIKQREAEAQEAARRAAAEEAASQGAGSDLPDQGSEAAADAVPPVRKEP